MTITERITARLDAMEVAARAVERVEVSFYPRWTNGHQVTPEHPEDTFDPAVVLGLVDGLRKVVTLHTPLEMTGGAVCTSCGDTDEHSTQWPCATLTALAAALDPVGEGSEGAEAAAEAPRSAATPVRRVPSHDDGCKDARETR